MKKMKVFALALCFIAGLSLTAFAQDTTTTSTTTTSTTQRSLYDRLGGVDAITKVIDEFASRVVADDRINKKFAKTDVPRLRLHLIEFVCKATGGPCEYTGLSMKASHKNMKVTDGEFNALVEDLGAALDKLGVGAQEKQDLVAALGPLKPDIVELPGDNSTGNALPPNFKPAKKLSAAQIAAGPKMKGAASTTGKKKKEKRTTE